MTKMNACYYIICWWAWNLGGSICFCIYPLYEYFSDMIQFWLKPVHVTCSFNEAQEFIQSFGSSPSSSLLPKIILLNSSLLMIWAWRSWMHASCYFSYSHYISECENFGLWKWNECSVDFISFFCCCCCCCFRLGGICQTLTKLAPFDCNQHRAYSVKSE